MSKFDIVTGEVRENLLMETAMSIMEIYRDMLSRKEISSDELDSIALLQLFCDWAREFENTYFGTDEYEDDYLSLVDEFASAKLNEAFMEMAIS